MTEKRIIYGTQQEIPQEWEVTDTISYHRTAIERLENVKLNENEESLFTGWRYEETQYTPEEYKDILIQQQQEKISSLAMAIMGLMGANGGV